MEKNTSSRWKPGQSGNPRGRRPGSGAVQELRREIEQLIPKIIQRMAQEALDGDVGAARLLLERAIPPLRPVDMQQAFNCPEGTLADQGRAIIAQGASGELSVAHVARLVGTISSLSQLIAAEDFEKRLAALESDVGA